MHVCWVTTICVFAFAPLAFGRQSTAATTRPTFPTPSQFTDDHICIDLLPRTDGAPGFTGVISVGGYRSMRRFPLDARLDGKIANGNFTDDSGNNFAFTAQMGGVRMTFKTGRTSYELWRVRGGIGIVPQQVSDGFRINDLLHDMPASQAGLRVGDVITEVDGQSMRGRDLEHSGLAGDVGTIVKVKVQRTDGSAAQFTFTRAPLDGNVFPGAKAQEETTDRGGDAGRDR
jgi:membrane-associated protease RseP (regulator of RpoE activity)